MQPDRLAFLFPDGLPDELAAVDLADASEETVEAVAEAFQDSLDEYEDDDPAAGEESDFGLDDEDIRHLVDGVIARQILLDDPPQVWAAVQRLETDGLDRAEIFDQIAEVLTPTLER